jgi:beta-lactamase regulating signal transducer with metallopeptidase domain
MSTFFEYMLKVSLCYGVVYLFYFLLLQRFTHYAGNRVFLLASSVLAFFIPLMRIDFFIAPQTLNATSFINSIPSVNVTAAKNIFIPEDGFSTATYILPALFVTGVIVCSAHFFIQLLSFKKIKSGAVFINETSGIKLYHLNMNIIPFSFGNAVYLNKELHLEEELKEIIQHESVHVHQKHTIDILVAQIVCILNWYNPFAWLIKHAIKQNLEFLADEGVIKNGTDKKSYQYLLAKVTGNSPLSIASNFNFSSLKKRIYMMNKSKTSKKHLLKFLFVLPVIAFMILSFRDTNSKEKNENSTNAFIKEETFKLSELTYSIPDPNIEMIIKREQKKSLLQVGKPFTITLIKNERDRLKSLLEKNGYININNHSISFLIDSSLTNNSFSVQVNIDLHTKVSINTNKNTSHKNLNAVGNENGQSVITSMNNRFAEQEYYAIDHHSNINVDAENFSII